MGIKARSCKAAVFFGLLAYILKNTHLWLWTIFTLDYFLGNPSFLEPYRWRLLTEASKSWPFPLNVTIPASHLPEIYAENYSLQMFKQVSESYTKPLIIRGLFKDVPAMKWTPELLANHFGEDRLFTAFINNGVGTQKGTFTTSVPSAVRNVSAGGNNYLFNSNFVYPDDVNMVRDIEIERLGWKPAILIQFFLGKARDSEPTKWRGSPMHAAVAPNVNVQLSGKKRWVMVDPKYYAYVKPSLLSTQVAVYVGGGTDYGEANRWCNFPRTDDILNPGDALYIPPWWMHEVQNLPTSKDVWQTSLALRFPDIRSSLWNGPLFTSLVDLGTVDKPCLPGFRMLCAEYLAKWEQNLQRLSPAAHETFKRFPPPPTNQYE